MNIFADFSIIPQFGAGLDFLGKFARAIIEGVGIIGVGIIVFTLVLKGITLPFDIYQRYKMRKQTLIMRNMKDDLDKLQKQYANDKTTYNQKMAELYKKNGYSMFGACLPMIISLVILIVAFQGFNSYSRYANVQQFVNMAETYNAAILEHAAGGEDYIVGQITDENENVVGFQLTNKQTQEKLFEFDPLSQGAKNRQWSDEVANYELVYGIDNDGDGMEDVRKVSIETDGQVVTREALDPYLKVTPVAETPELYLIYYCSLGAFNYEYRPEDPQADADKIVVSFVPAETIERKYQIDADRLLAYLATRPETETDVDGNSAPTFAKETKDAIENAYNDPQLDEISKKEAVRNACRAYVVKTGALAAKDYFFDKSRKDNPAFLWIKNVWEADATYKHPVPKKTVSSKLEQDQYENLISELTPQTSSHNGYYILIILSIGTMALSQFITMRSQKESNKYQTADGQGAKSQKFMLIFMPLLYAVFAFLYSAAFSIYMIMSSVISLAVTLICNLILGKIFKKKEEEAVKAQYGRKLAWKDGGNQKNKSKNNRAKKR